MSRRLADYLVVVGFDTETGRNGIPNGKILQRFPLKDWSDTPFIDGMELFCQPQGWSLSIHQEEPKYFMSVLTNIDGNHYYCAVLCFNEKISITPSKPVDEEEENLTLGKSNQPTPAAITHHNIMYAPKCLVLVSRLDYSETFKNCLGTIYTVYLENFSYPLETLIGNILGCIQIPPAGGPQVRFSIGASDKQALQPPLSATLPVTGSCVSLLFKQLGKKNVLLLYCAAMTEHKILFHSTSYSRLSDSCRALTSLMYPLRYTHTYVPILPASILEILSTPTPFIMGIHSSLQNEVNDVLDVIVADLDGGSIYIPESLISPVSKLPPSLWDSTCNALTIVLQPELAEADNAFTNGSREGNDNRNQLLLDKEIRAIFMRIFAQLMQGYRSCLTLIRINPKPVIEFHKAAFLGSRDLVDTDFLSRVLDSMFFTTFVTERGPPWRPWDAWDELYNAMPEYLKTEAQDRRLVLVHIQELAQKLYINETPNPQLYQQKVLMPPEGAFSRIHQPPFPEINADQVQMIINEGITKNDLQTRMQSFRNNPRIVPIGPHLPSFNDGRPIVTHTARKMEVLKTCVSCIFENKIADARKIFQAVLRILKQRDDARLFLCRELAKVVQGSHKAMLEHQQFDLIIKLMNRALQDDSAKYQHDIAASLLPLSMLFCRKLCNGVIQFAYSCIQGHPIWKTQMFWEQAFYQDVQTNVKNLYINKPIERNSYLINESSSTYDYRAAQEPSALEIAAKQMMDWPQIDKDKQQDLINSEESILYSQAVHYANRMVSLLIPLDVRCGVKKVKKMVRHMEDDTSISNSVLESRSTHSDVGFEDHKDASETENAVVKQVCKFIDKVCNEGAVTHDHIKNLHSMIPGLVDMHAETLDIVCRESKRIPPVQKPKIQIPMMLMGEEIIGEPIRTVLLADGREETHSPLLPAEGALFLTNYRVIFRGLPCDSLACEQSVIRAFPVASLTKEKRISGILSNEQVLPDGLQLRSCTFQLIKVAFDEEVTQETIELFRKSLNRCRHPEDEFGHFAFVNHIMAMKPTNQNKKEKNATLKGFAKKTLLRTARKAGFKQKSKTNRKYIFSGSNDDDFYANSGGVNAQNNNNVQDSDEDEGSDDNFDSMPRVTVKDVERLKERSFVKDWQRLGLANNSFGFRISQINCNYSLCRTYPAIIVCPKDINDDQLKSLAKTYKNQRIPVPTWRHQNGSCLLRGSVSLAKGVMGMLKHSGSANTSTDSTCFQDQDRYFSAIIPHARTPYGSNMHNSESSISIDSLAFNKNHMTNSLTPMSNRKDGMGIRMTSSSSSSNNHKPNKWESLKRGANNALRDLNQTWDDQYTMPQRVRVPLYFLGERSQTKSAKLSEMCAEYIPVYYNDNRHSREAFKKLMRGCLPSTINNEPDQTFAKLIEQSEWLQQIRSLLQLSGTVVDLMDLQEASVNLAFEDGWDITCQVSSLAQLCLDPHYRTIEGFRVLIEKEWLAFGHRFGHRSNLKPNSSSFAPIFLQFLDAVHQIQHQFPLSFEFNEFYLKFLAYHSVSCRFRTFLFDCELERVDLGITAVEDKRGSLNSHHKHIVETGTGSDDDNIYPGGVRSNTNQQQKLGISIFDYIERHNVRAPVFYNFMYTADPDNQVLRPQSSISMLEIWDYFINEELAQGPSYDLELIGAETIDDDPEFSSKQPKRKVVTLGYDNISRHDSDAFTRMLEELKQTEAERGILPQKWKQVWDKLELPHSDSLTRHSSFSSALVRSHGRHLHKRSTLEILTRGQLAGYQESFSHPHRFEKHAFTTPTYCNLCGNLLWGPVRNGLRCIDCGNSYHEKCADSVPKNCTKYKTIEGPQTTMSRNQGDNASVASSANTTSNDIYKIYDSNVPENRTHEGHLYKRGALLKGWKQRWFVLDSIKHQLRYYDSVEDSNCKGHIDLAEVQVVGPAQATPVQSRRVDEKAFFDLKTGKRTYNFYAQDAAMAQEWIEKIQACLQ